jgi:hypothetical protein
VISATRRGRSENSSVGLKNRNIKNATSNSRQHISNIKKLKIYTYETAKMFWKWTVKMFVQH